MPEARAGAPSRALPCPARRRSTRARSWILPLALLSLLLARPAVAQESRWILSAGGGAALPLDEIDEFWGIGFTLGGDVAYELSDYLRVGTEAVYQRFPFDLGTLSELIDIIPGIEVDIDGGAVSNFLAVASGRFSPLPDEAIRPLLLVGAGYYRLELTRFVIRTPTDTETVPGTTEDGIGVVTGVGLETDLSRRVALFAEGRLGLGFDFGGGTDEFIPLWAGVSIRP